MSKTTGLVFDRLDKRFVHGRKCGFGYGWMPYRVEMFISLWFNRAACAVTRHDDLIWHLQNDEGSDWPADHPARCLYCLKHLDGCVGHKEA